MKIVDKVEITKQVKRDVYEDICKRNAVEELIAMGKPDMDWANYSLLGGHI